jgi:hypothetical protein
MAIDVQMKMASPRIKEKSAFTTTTDETNQTNKSNPSLHFNSCTNIVSDFTQVVTALQLFTYLITFSDYCLTTTNQPNKMKVILLSLILALLNHNASIEAFSISHSNKGVNVHQPQSQSPTALSMAMDVAMRGRLDNIDRSYQALTERLADPDVLSDSNLLMKVMSDRSKSEATVIAYQEVSLCLIDWVLLVTFFFDLLSRLFLCLMSRLNDSLSTCHLSYV